MYYDPTKWLGLAEEPRAAAATACAVLETFGTHKTDKLIERRLMPTTKGS